MTAGAGPGGFPRGEGPFTVYLCFDDAGRTRFVGYTRHLDRRRELHRSRGLRTRAFVRVGSVELARGVEQKILDELGGPRPPV